MMEGVVDRGTARSLKDLKMPLAGKTGTTNDAKDAWFAGFNGKLVAIAWVGFDQPRTLGRREYGGVAALPIWSNFMAKSLAGTPSTWVRFDKDASAPISRDELQVQQSEDQKVYRASPPLARPLYRPAPVVPTRSIDNDFSDLPGTAPSADEQIIVPSKKQPPALGTETQSPSPKKERDNIENLINQIQ